MDAKDYKFNLILYHANCVDGFGAAYCAWRSLGDSAEYIACNHGDTPPDVTGKRVLVLDFSFKRDVVERLNDQAEFFMILDHHKSAMEDLSDLPYAYFDMEHSGAMLAWALFNPGVTAPLFISYIEDRDLWKWELPRSREVCAGIDTVAFDFEEYKRLEFEPTLGEIASVGKILLSYSEKKILSICESSSDRVICGTGLSAKVVNSRQWHSDVGSRLAAETDVAVVWYHDHERDKIKVSLRSQGPSVDVSSIAFAYGGGGHANAAGFTIDASSGKTIEGLFDDKLE